MAGSRSSGDVNGETSRPRALQRSHLENVERIGDSPSELPEYWNGPIPDPMIRRRMSPSDGDVEVSASMLHGGFQDLSVLIWAQLRQWSGDAEGVTTYLELASAMGLNAGTPAAVKVRFSSALQSLLGTWISRRRVDDGRYAYRRRRPNASVPAR